jgi:AAA15 family ATPase/GTPase
LAIQASFEAILRPNRRFFAPCPRAQGPPIPNAIRVAKASAKAMAKNSGKQRNPRKSRVSLARGLEIWYNCLVKNLTICNNIAKISNKGYNSIEVIILLIGFTVENFRSFLGEASLSMIATSDKEHREFNVINTKHDDLLKNVLIYGANASGKSNLIHALHYMKKMVSSSIDVQTEHIKTYRPFTFREDAKELPTKFEISFADYSVIDYLADSVGIPVVYDYGFEILGGKISREYLYKKAQRRTLVFERTAPEYDSITLSTADMSDVESLKKNVRSDVLFLSWAAYVNNALAIKIVDWVTSKLLIFGLPDQRIEFSKTVSALAKDFVRKSDNDILEMRWQPGSVSDAKPQSTKELFSTHSIYDKDWVVTQAIDVPFEEYSSEGTKRMFELSDAFGMTLTESSVIVIDELDLHLHPALVRHLIALINSVEHNPKNAQLICTTHDVMLLDEDIRRDQVWFVDKDKRGVSSLYALSDFKDVRKNSDILKRYLLGVYGAVPNLSGGDRDE